jgi:DNA gyrase/topoisomerase IV subunit A
MDTIIITRGGFIKIVISDDIVTAAGKGLRVISLKPGDEVVSTLSVGACTEKNIIVMITKKGIGISVPATCFRLMGTVSYGVRAIKLGRGDKVVSAFIVKK